MEMTINGKVVEYTTGVECGKKYYRFEHESGNVLYVYTYRDMLPGYVIKRQIEKYGMSTCRNGFVNVKARMWENDNHRWVTVNTPVYKTYSWYDNVGLLNYDFVWRANWRNEQRLVAMTYQNTFNC